MRILLWAELFWPYVGGAELFAAKLMLALRERGHEFLVLTSHDNLELPDEDRYDGIPIHRLPFRSVIAGGDLERFREVKHRVMALKRGFAPDLIHVNSVGPSLLFRQVTVAADRVPGLVRLSTEILPSQWAGRGSLLYEALVSASWVVGCSATVLAQARRLAPEITPRSSMIRGGVDLPTRTPGLVPVDPPRLLCLGRLVHAKGFDIALAALARLVPRFPGLRLTLAGDGVARPDLERRVAELGLTATVDFLSWVDPSRVFDLLDEATVVLLPSRREGLPLLALQAALMARPIVASRVGGLPEIVVNDETGLLIEREDAEGLARAITVLLEHPEAAARMGWAARRRAQELMNWDRCVEGYDVLYRTLAGGTHAHFESALGAEHR